MTAAVFHQECGHRGTFSFGLRQERQSAAFFLWIKNLIELLKFIGI